jgi:glucoamylase
MKESPEPLFEWMERQYRYSAAAMLRAISATRLIKERRHLGQTIRPARGSVLASPEIASYDPNPDYFFHWLRDSSIVMDALRELIAEQAIDEKALECFVDFIRFSLGLCRLDGRDLSRGADFRRAADPEFLKNIRSESELNQIFGDRALGEVRYNPDGTLDVIKWARPQNDGPALRALTVLRLLRLEAFQEYASEDSCKELLELDLDYTLRHWRETCLDLWEEISGSHYYTRIVQYAALDDGSKWMAAMSDTFRAENYRTASLEIGRRLDDHFDPREGVYLACMSGRHATPGISRARQLDISVILGAIHSGRLQGAHSVLDPKILATLAQLESLFAAEYRINRERAVNCAPAMGRYAGDVYYSGGAYYFSTLGAAQFYFSFAEALAKGATIPVSTENRSLLANMLAEPSDAFAAQSLGAQFRKRLYKAFLDRGDMFMEMVRAHTPATGELSEQFDQTNGSQTSAKNLAWSYAAFITAFLSRKLAKAAMRDASRPESGNSLK